MDIEDKLEIDISKREREIEFVESEYKDQMINIFDTQMWIHNKKYGQYLSKMLRPKEIKASDEEESNPIASLVDGSENTKWSVKGDYAWVIFDFGRNVLIDSIEIDFHMKMNERREYEFSLFSVKKELGNDQFEYVPIMMDLNNNRLKRQKYYIHNYRVLVTDTDKGKAKLDVISTSKLMFWFTKTSTKRKRFSINDIKVYGANVNDVEIKEGETNMTRAIIGDEDTDNDTFDKNGVIYLPEYEVIKERYDWTKNFQSTSLRFDFEGERPATSIIVGGLFYIDSKAIDDISGKTEGGPHNDRNPECGRCNDTGLQYDGKRFRYRKEKRHEGGAGYTNNLVSIDNPCGDLRGKWIGYAEVSQVVTVKDKAEDEGITGRRFRIYVDENAKNADGTLNNNYKQIVEFLDVGQYMDDGEALPIYNESACDEAQTTLRLDKLSPKDLKYENLFLRDIKPDVIIKNPEPGPVKIPPKVIVAPEIEVTQKGQTIVIDASASNDPDGEIDCFKFKQIGSWMVDQRLKLKALEGNDMGKLEVTYPVLNNKPITPLKVAVTVVDNDKLEKMLPVTIIDKIDYGTIEPPTELRVQLTIPQTSYEVPKDQFPFKIPITVNSTGGKPPYTKAITTHPSAGVTILTDGIKVDSAMSLSVEVNIIDMDGKSVTDSKTVTVTETAEQPSGNVLYDSNIDIDWNAIKEDTLKVTDVYGTFKAGTKYFRCKASGNPRAILYKATKEICLEHDGKYGRLYFGVCNYESMLEGEFKLQKTSHNASFKIRNRHQYADVVSNAPDEKRQGGQGTSYHFDSVDADLEVVHGTEIGGPSSNLSPKLEANKYYKFRFSQFDKNGKIHVIDELDYGDGKGLLIVNEGDVAAPKQFFNKAEFEEWSEFWVRLNADEGGQLYVKNLKMTDLSKAREAISL